MGHMDDMVGAVAKTASAHVAVPGLLIVLIVAVVAVVLAVGFSRKG
jgi:hypothetical protein